MITFLAVIGGIFCFLFLAALLFGVIISIGTYVEEKRAYKRNRKEGNLKFTVDKPHRFKKN